MGFKLTRGLKNAISAEFIECDYISMRNENLKKF